MLKATKREVWGLHKISTSFYTPRDRPRLKLNEFVYSKNVTFNEAPRTLKPKEETEFPERKGLRSQFEFLICFFRRRTAVDRIEKDDVQICKK